MDSDSDETLSDENDSSISSDELERSDSEDDGSLVEEEFRQSSMDDWEWKLFYFFTITLQAEEKKVSATGTIRSDRKYFPTKLKKGEKLERGDYRYLTPNGAFCNKMDGQER
ncbi:unnamed protein product, partial [Rotaria socialis]